MVTIGNEGTEVNALEAHTLEDSLRNKLIWSALSSNSFD